MPEPHAGVPVVVSHFVPHLLQFVGVLSCVSHPFVLGAVVLQSP